MSKLFKMVKSNEGRCDAVSPRDQHREDGLDAVSGRLVKVFEGDSDAWSVID